MSEHLDRAKGLALEVRDASAMKSDMYATLLVAAGQLNALIAIAEMLERLEYRLPATFEELIAQAMHE